MFVLSLSCLSLGLLIGALLSYLLLRLKLASKQQELLTLRSTLDSERQRFDYEKALLVQEKDAELTRLQDRLSDQEQAQAQFRALSNDVLQSQSRSYTKLQTDSLELLLAPIRELMQKLSSDTAGAKESFRSQMEVFVKASEGLGRDAQALTHALTGDAKTQGNWGELTLERLLERAGLREHETYELQPSFNKDEGRARPDVVIFLPGDRKLIIDAKTSLTAFVAGSVAHSVAERDRCLAQHALSVKKHIDELAAKKYPEHVKNSFPQVMMFIPNEASYIAAMQTDPSLFDHAAEKNVLLIVPSTLFAMLHLVNTLWAKEKQNKNVEEIVKTAKSLYEKMVGSIEDFDLLGKRLDDAQRAFAESRKKVYEGKGNAVSLMNRLLDCGVSPSKKIEE